MHDYLLIVQSLLLDKLLPCCVGIGPSPAASALTVPDIEVCRSAVDVVLAERRRPGHVVRVEDVRFLPCFSGKPLLREALVLHQIWVVTVFPTLRQRQRVLKNKKNI